MKRNINTDDLIKLYKNGKSTREISELFGVSQDCIAGRLKRGGVNLTLRMREDRARSNRKPRIVIPDDSMREITILYQSGWSLLRLQKRFGINRGIIKRSLEALRVPVRGQTEANRLLISQRTPEERRRYAQAAHEAVRGRRRSPEERRKAALTIQRKALTKEPSSKHERRFLKISQYLGLKVIPQYAIKTYNVDFLITGAPIAVEISSSMRATFGRDHPAIISIRKKFEDLFNLGFCVIFILAEHPVHPIKRRCVQKVIRICDVFRENQSSLRQQYVMWGDGNCTTAGSRNFDYRTGIPRSNNSQWIRCLNDG